ncbi:hypothetical protein DQQ01_05620 [Blautia argi]|uniref:Uncharacterized protein n=1 Tax=Blautia argi TaxID=1912897 RepID=A0A2Z4U9I8_9FIRM|nr:hypothetical protein DQQ01_05620 [Blautia argi]
MQLREDCTAAEWNDVADATSHRQRIPQEGFFVIGKFEKRRKGILCGKWENAASGDFLQQVFWQQEFFCTGRNFWQRPQRKER